MSTPSNTTGWNRLRLLLEEALQLPAPEQSAWLDRLAPADAHLRAELEALLATDEGADGLLEVLGAEQRVGQRIGPYRLVRLVGRGGMGSVYCAVRDDDQFEQVVALKLLGFSDADESLRQRFHAERQILARLEHPHIARLLDGGTENGRPYFVMEYVEGQPLDRYCSERRLGVRARVSLFLDVCSAVQYAHQNLVVHRDLKPGNILVDRDGRPKLLDFGIAKLLEAPSSLATATLWQPMTPEYASPEQASGAAVGTSSDVYSLGVLLYELLAGRRPHDLGGLAPDELCRVICAAVPAPPSVRVVGEATLPEPPERWSRQLRGDLDTIVLMALRKEPQRRYSSAEALAEDLRRFLDGRPVRARRDTWSYRAGKFLRRNRWPVAATALLAISLVGGVSATVWQKRRAERRFQDLRGLARTFIFDVHDAVSALPGSTGARDLIVSSGVQYLDRLAADAGEDDSLLEELAHGYERLGDVAGGAGQPSRGNHTTALASYGKALGIRRRLDARTQTPASLRALLRALTSLGRAHVSSGDKPAARACLEEALALAAARPADGHALAPELARAHGALGSLFMRDGRSEEALRHLRSAVDVLQAARQRSPGDLALLELAAKPSTDLALVLQRAGRLQEAEQAFEAAARAWEALLLAQPGNRAHLRGRAILVSSLASFHELRGEHVESVRQAELAVGQFQELAGTDPRDVEAQRDLLLANVKLANAATTAGRSDTAIGAARTAVAISEALLAGAPDNPGRDRDTFLASGALAESLENAGRAAEALPIRRRALDWAVARQRRLPDHAYAPLDVALGHQGLGKALLSCARPDEALEHLDRSRALLTELSHKDPASAERTSNLVATLIWLGDAHAARARRSEGAQHEDQARAAYAQALERLEGLRDRALISPASTRTMNRLQRILAGTRDGAGPNR